MTDFHTGEHPDFGQLAEKLPALPADDEWAVRWKERREAVRTVLGETVEPGIVQSFSWKDYVLPGACALTYKQSDYSFLYMTLGLTQPFQSTERSYPWEFAVRANEHSEWPVDLLYQLVSQWLWQDGKMWFGGHLPLTFFIGHDGKMWPSISEGVQHRRVVGAIRGLYLWTDSALIRFKASSGEFGLLTAVGVTGDEDELANETTPAHLMLLLRRMGVTQLCDPHRTSVLNLPNASDEWDRIKRMGHDDALDELQRV